MAAILKATYGVAVTAADWIWNYCDPRTCHLPLATNPLPMMSIIAVYLYFVKSWGPAMMKNREPFKLRTIMLVYNAVQVVWCAYIVREGIRLVWGGKYSFRCQPFSMATEPEDFELASIAYQYFLLKIIDLLDTVFMILRKNDRQITFLHVYHHAFMVFAIWFGAKAIPGGHSTFVGLINCVVHVILYAYYFLTLYNPNIKVAWWKKYITIIQLVQFAMNIIHEFYPLFIHDCGVHQIVSGVVFLQNFFFFALFFDFYLKNYSSSAVKKEKAKN